MSADGAATPPPTPPSGGNRIPIAIEEEMKSAFMDYAMSVIVSRALPDARDGLKPVHRRILYTQHQMSNFWNRGYIKCARVVGEVLSDIDKETVNFQPNYDDRETEPTVLPARFPNLLVNGAAGIAVGMATNIPPHNLREVISATIALA